MFGQPQVVPIDTYPTVGGYPFGMITSLSVKYLPEAPAIFVCMGRGMDGRRFLFDIDHADNVRLAVAQHPRVECWRRATASGETMEIGLHITALPASSREDVVQKIRAQYPALLCG